MSYSLTPVVVDLRRVKALMGSKDVALLRDVVQKHRREMLDTDALFGDFEEFEADIKKEYKAFAAGDFSGVDLRATYDVPDDEDDDEPDPETEAFARAYKAARTEAARRKVWDAFMEKTIREVQEEGDDEGDDGEPVRVLSTGAALAHLILGGNRDPSAWSQYGYALQILCEHLGDVPADYDSWCTIRSSTFDHLDRVLKRAGIPPKKFATAAFLVERGPPVKILEPDDFPYVGYLTRAEARRVLRLLDPAKLDPAIRRTKEDRDWVRDAFGELRAWLETAAKTDRDLVCFYC